MARDKELLKKVDAMSPTLLVAYQRRIEMGVPLQSAAVVKPGLSDRLTQSGAAADLDDSEASEDFDAKPVRELAEKKRRV